MFHFSMEKVKSASRGIFWLGGALPAVGSLFTDFLSPLGPYSFFLALLLGVLTVLALIAAVIPPVNRVLHSWSAHWAEGVLAVLLCGFLVFFGMFALELSTDPNKGFLASKSEKLAEMQKILLDIADTTARIDARTERIEEQTARTDARTERIEEQTARTDARTERIEEQTARTDARTERIEEQTARTDARTERIEQQTARIDARTERIEGKVSTIDRKMDGLKRETSDDPRKELVNLGVTYNTKGYCDALSAGDERILSLFYQAGMDFHAQPEIGEQPCIVQLCMKDVPTCMKVIAVASRCNVNVQKGISTENYHWIYRGLPEHLAGYLVRDALMPLGLLDKYPLVKGFVTPSKATYTIVDIIILCADGNTEQIAKFIRKHNMPHENTLKLRRELADYFSASNDYSTGQQSNEAQRYFNLEVSIPGFVSPFANNMKSAREEAEHYDNVTRQLEKALGASR